jgi:hypothetical protein
MDVYEKMVWYFSWSFHVEILLQHFHHQDIVQQLSMDRPVKQMLVFRNLYSSFYSFVQHENNIFLLLDYVLVNDVLQFVPNDNHHYANHLQMIVKRIDEKKMNFRCPFPSAPRLIFVLNPIQLFVLTANP